MTRLVALLWLLLTVLAVAAVIVTDSTLATVCAAFVGLASWHKYRESQVVDIGRRGRSLRAIAAGRR